MNELFDVKHPSELAYIEVMEQHSRGKARKVDDIRKGNAIATDKIEFVYPVIPESHVNFAPKNASKKGGNKGKKARKK